MEVYAQFYFKKKKNLFTSVKRLVSLVLVPLRLANVKLMC